MIWCSRIQPLLRGPWVDVVGLPEMVREPQAQLGAIPHDRWSGGHGCIAEHCWQLTDM